MENVKSFDLHLPLWLTITAGIFFILAAIVCMYFTKISMSQHRKMRDSFEKKYKTLSQDSKSQFSKDRYWVKNTTMWTRSKHLIWPLLVIVFIGLGIMFLAGRQFGLEII